MIYHHRLALLPLLVGLFTVADAGATEYWVSKSGSDSHSCTNATADACLTIQKGVSILKAGDVLNVKAGTYTDDAGASPYHPLVSSPGGIYCGWLDAHPGSANVCVEANGTPGNLITIQAAPGDEGNVVIDAQNARVGIHMRNSDYIRIRGFKIINSRTEGIASWGQPENAVADVSRLSIGVVIENNTILNTRGAWGENTSAIGMWSSKDWVVRNNVIDGASIDGGGTLAGGIQAYGTINALIANNLIRNVDYGVFWKDHFIGDLATRTPIFESEIRYNVINPRKQGIVVGIMGDKSEEAGENYIHHNIIYGYADGTDNLAAISYSMGGAYAISAKVRIEQNLMESSNPMSIGVWLGSSRDATIKGNIVSHSSNDMIILNSGFSTNVTYADYNIYTFSGPLMADYGGATKYFSSLTDWRAAVSSSVASLKTDHPDTHGKSAGATNLFLDNANHNYKYAAGSAAIGMMPDGSNAGPYQAGSEVVGLLPGWPSYSATVSSAPVAPPSFSVTPAN